MRAARKGPPASRCLRSAAHGLFALLGGAYAGSCAPDAPAGPLPTGELSPSWGEATSAATRPRVRARHPEAAPWATRVERICAGVFAELGDPQRGVLLWVELTEDPGDFARRSGRKSFEGAAFVAPTIWLQPEAVLSRLPYVDEILRHECVHAWLDAQGLAALPHALAEALAAGVAGQAARLPPAEPYRSSEWTAANAQLRAPASPEALQHELARAVATFWPALARLDATSRLAWLRRALGHACPMELLGPPADVSGPLHLGR